MAEKKGAPMTGRLTIVPMRFAEACSLVQAWHRHHDAPRGHLFSIGVADEEGTVRGACIIGRPVNRTLQDGWTAEVIRVATDGCPNACSALYAAAWRACRAMGYLRLVTYTLASEPGTSLTAAGWKAVHQVQGHKWDHPSRRRIDKHPTVDKLRWEVSA